MIHHVTCFWLRVHGVLRCSRRTETLFNLCVHCVRVCVFSPTFISSLLCLPSEILLQSSAQLGLPSSLILELFRIVVSTLEERPSTK